MTKNDTQTAVTPRWVKAFALIALALVVLIVVMLIIGRGGHGPGRHIGAGSGGHTGAPPSLTHGQA